MIRGWWDFILGTLSEPLTDEERDVVVDGWLKELGEGGEP